MAPARRRAGLSLPVQVGLAVLAWLLACRPVADWYLQRVLIIPDQGWLALAPLTALVLAAGRGGWNREAGWRRWVPAAGIMLAYAACLPAWPMTIRAAVAAAVLLFLPGPWRRGFWPAAPVAGLALIGLPAMAMLQFYFGFPLQILAASLAVPILRTAGLPVVREGALLTVGGAGVGVDTVCGGIKMGWAALYLAFTLSGLAGLGWIRTGLAAACAAVFVLLLNAVRVAVLAGVDAAGLGGRPVLHAGVGVMLFLALATGLALIVRRLERRPS